VILPAVGCVLAIAAASGCCGVRRPLWIGDSAWDVWALGLLAMPSRSILFAIATWRTKALEPRAGRAHRLGAIGSSVSAMISPIRPVRARGDVARLDLAWHRRHPSGIGCRRAVAS
jgi:hypothetical protein